MSLKWPPMTTIRPDQTTVYRTPGQRLYWAEHSLSLAVPPTCSAEAGRDYCQIRSEPESLEGFLSLHNYTGDIVGYWVDESFRHGAETLEPVEPRQTQMDVVSRRFASHSRVGYKVMVDDVFGNGISAHFSAAAERAGDLSRLLAQVVDSVRFVEFHSLEGNAPKPVFGFVNCGAKTGDELFRYINRHFYVMQDEVMDPIRLLAEDAEKGGRPGAQRLKTMWEVLQSARKIADEGTWDQTIADARGARP